MKTRSITTLMASGLLAATMASTALQPAFANTGNGTDWRPPSSETLIKVPVNLLGKVVDREFSESPHALELQDLGSDIANKAQSLNDLKAAIEESDGEIRLELRHRLLAEKSNYLKLMNRQQELRRETVERKMTLYKRLQRKLDREARLKGDPEQVALVANMEDARNRFERNVKDVDLKLFEESMVPESKYSVQYNKNAAAIRELAAAIGKHEANQQLLIDGQPMDRRSFVRQMYLEAQSELSLLEQEGDILGMMAKLVSLDAQALEEEILEDHYDVADAASYEDQSIAGSVDLFLD